MILNFIFDLLLLITVSILLKRNVSIYKLLAGAFIGGISILFLFVSNSLLLFFYKFIISIIMIIISFGYKSMKYTLKNLFYLYISSIVLGGFLYFLNIEFSYKQYGLIFVNNGLSINFIFLIIFSPVILYIYIKQGIWLRNNYNNYYKTNIYYNNQIFSFVSFLDTGNNLNTPITNKPVILIDKKINVNNFFYIPYKCIKGEGLIKCFKADKIEIEGIVKKNVIIGIMNEKIKIDGVNCLLNKKILER